MMLCICNRLSLVIALLNKSNPIMIIQYHHFAEQIKAFLIGQIDGVYEISLRKSVYDPFIQITTFCLLFESNHLYIRRAPIDGFSTSYRDGFGMLRVHVSSPTNKYNGHSFTAWIVQSRIPNVFRLVSVQHNPV